MARILLIETATEVCSVAIAADGKPVALHETPEPAAARLTLQIEACVAESGIPLSALDAVALSAGPGSYTGLRVGASVAKGICYALDKPLIAVDTLLALAAASLWEMGNLTAVRQVEKLEIGNSGGAGSEFPISNFQFPILLPMLDARRQEVWTAAYDAGLRRVAPAQPLILENQLFEMFLEQYDLSPAGGLLVLSGNGSKKPLKNPHPERIVFSPVVANSAAQLAPLAEKAFEKKEFQDLAYFEPHYMKAPNITTSTKSLF